MSLISASDYWQAKAEIERLKAQCDEYRELLLSALRHHQGGKSEIGQAIRTALGIEQFEKLDDKAIAKASTPQPELKNLDQSIFDCAPEWAEYAAVRPDGLGWFYEVDQAATAGGWLCKRWPVGECKIIDSGFDASDWENSLIKRDRKAKRTQT